MITSIKNPRIKTIRDLLSSRKQRESNGLMVLEGVRLVEEALQAGIEIKECLFSQNLSDRGKSALNSIQKRGISAEELSVELMNRISDTQTAQGILLVTAIPDFPIPKSPNLILTIDQLSDPGNMGTILRTCAALDIDGIFLTPGTTDPFAPKALRSAMGAQLYLPILWKTPKEIDDFCHLAANSLAITTSQLDCGHPCWEKDLSQAICLVIGSEAHGVSDDLLSIADDCITIPIGKKAESFNAAIAAGILLYEVTRQRKRK